MIVEFNVSNFRSIKEKQTLSLIAAPISSKSEIDQENVFMAPDGIKLLKSVAIYGANGSGKSNMIRALMWMMQFVEKAFGDGNSVNSFEPFALDEDYEREPSQFEVIFYAGDTRFRYGFEITGGNRVSAEWLFGPARKNEVEYFTRVEEKVKVNKASYKEGLSLIAANLRDSALALNIIHDLGGPVAKEIKDYLRRNIVVTLGINDKTFQVISRDLLMDDTFGERILQLLRSADTGIMDVRNVEMEKLVVVQEDGSEGKVNLQQGETKKFLMSMRQIKNSRGANNTRVFFFNEFESEGTKRLFAYAGPIVESLLNGLTFVVDEFDASLHPNLTRKIVELYNSKELNPNNAQLIFVTHDVNLLDQTLLRRDQIYFAEKNNAGETSLYSLVNVKGVRNDASYEKDYVKGKYGAIPYLANFKRSLK